MFRFAIYLFFVLALCQSASAASFEYAMQQCRRIAGLNPPEIRVTYNYGNLKFDTTKTAEELAKLYSKTENKKSTHKITGLTQLFPHINVASQLSQRSLTDGRYCLYPSKIDIKLWYEPIVYLLKSLEAGSCKFNVTLRHEQTHLDFGHYALYLLTRAIKAQMPKIVEDIGPRVVSETAETEAQTINDEYVQQVGTLFDVFKNTLRQYNNKIDNNENYLTESSLCK